MKTRKIDNIILKTYQIIITTFFVLGKDDKIKFFKEIFLLTNIKLDVVFDILFLIISNINIDL